LNDSLKERQALVSVIIPTYNRAALLIAAIRSLVAQTYRPFECIIVDDGSTDNTKQLVEELAADTDEEFILKYIQQSNAGSQVARNTGTAAATGEFIQYLDSDDILYPDKIKQHVNYLLRNKDCAGVFGDWKVGTTEKNETIIAYKSEDLITQILTKRCIANFRFLMRRAIVEKIGDWDVDIKRNQEIDFHLRGILAGGKFDYQPGLCGLWRIHSNERIVTNTGLNDIIYFYRRAEMLLRNYELFNQKIANGIADLYMWLISQNKNNKNEILIPVMQEVVRLNPDVAFYKNYKMKVLSIILSEKKAMEIWLNRFRSTSRSLKEPLNG
jgi:glycosyltransferase involved in cell wall biosynthesis